MKLGKRQLAWVEALEAHPERQMKGGLGKGTPRKYKACCLGEACLVKARRLGDNFPFLSDGDLFDEKTYTTGILNTGGDTVKYFALRSGTGSAEEDFKIERHPKHFVSLANANDNGASWTEIAAAIRRNPANFFTESK